MIGYLLFVTIFVTVRTETCTGSCKDMLQGYLTGQASSALATYQIEALKREFKSFTGLIEESMNTFKQKIQQDIRTQGEARKHKHKCISLYKTCTKQNVHNHDLIDIE